MPQVSVRSKILEAGFRVIYANGFNGSSIQDITDAAGVPKGSFYNHFKSKEDLAIEVMAVYRTASRLELLADVTMTPLQRLRSHFDFMCSVWKIRGYREGCLLGNLGTELAVANPMLRKVIQGHFTDWIDAVADLVLEAQQAGALSAATPADQMARVMVSAWEGAVMTMKIHQSKQPLDDFFAVTLPALIGTPPTTTGRPPAGAARKRARPVAR